MIVDLFGWRMTANPGVLRRWRCGAAYRTDDRTTSSKQHALEERHEALRSADGKAARRPRPRLRHFGRACWICHARSCALRMLNISTDIISMLIN